MRQSRIRNFSIIAHIDHGKSTLADRFLELAGQVDPRRFRDQLLDAMDLERERGITIKAHPVRLQYVVDGVEYQLNLIDTPGHVDFHYEVSRSLAACEGAVLLVDAVQGVEAQTVANAFLALEHNLVIVPVINKIDLPNARVEAVIDEMVHMLGVDPAAVLRASARTGQGAAEVLAEVVRRVPPPQGRPEAPARALVFDSVFNDYRGVIMYVRVVDGAFRPGQRIRLLRRGTLHQVDEVGIFRPDMQPVDSLSAGEVGYLIANIKEMSQVHIGDTVAEAVDPLPAALPGYQEPKPMVFCGLYPSRDTDIHVLREALERLRLNDSSFSFQPEHSEGLGLGFRCGFLGLLHMEIVQQRLERESDVDLIQSAPNVTYEILLRNGQTLRVEKPSEVPEAGRIQEFREPVVAVNLIVPAEAIGGVMQLAEQRRALYKRTEYLGPGRVILSYELPLAEMIYDFHDKLKSLTRGFGTMDYELVGFRPEKLVRVDILVAGRRVDPLSFIVHRDQAQRRARALVRRLRDEIPRHQFEVVIQAAIGGRVIARESLPPLAKAVTAKCYGGDITRKRKLLSRQREGKKRLKQVGHVEIPQRAFLAVLEAEI